MLVNHITVKSQLGQWARHPDIRADHMVLIKVSHPGSEDLHGAYRSFNPTTRSPARARTDQ
jgi:hypothetical protein